MAFGWMAVILKYLHELRRTWLITTTGVTKDMRHFPARKPGCYYGRVTDSCWLCVVRSVGKRMPFRRPDELGESGGDLVSRRVVVTRPEDDRSAERIEGEVIDVCPTDTSKPDIVIVAVDDDRLALPVTRIRPID